MIALTLTHHESSDSNRALGSGRRVLICQDGRPANRRNYSVPAAQMHEAFYFRRMIENYFGEFLHVSLQFEHFSFQSMRIDAQIAELLVADVFYLSLIHI